MSRLLAVVCLLASPVPAPAQDDTPLRFGMDIASPPWAFVPGWTYSESTGLPATIDTARVRGLDVDVMHAIAKRLGRRAEVVPQSWLDLEQGLLEGRYDAILCAWTPSTSTPTEIAASRAYHGWGLVLVVAAKRSDVHSYQDLGGLKVGHLRDPSVVRSLYAIAHEDTRLAAYDDGAEMFRDLEAGRLDALIYDSTFVLWWGRTHAGFRVVGDPLNKLGYHVGVRKADADLLASIDAALQEWLASPEPLELRERWEGGR